MLASSGHAFTISCCPRRHDHDDLQIFSKELDAMQDMQICAPGHGSKWFGMLLAIAVTCVSVIPTIQIAYAYD
jgi:hypothetical protein